MPAINQFVAKNRNLISAPQSSTLSVQNSSELGHETKIKKLISVQLLLAYAYWSVCGLFLLIFFLVVWLYMREVSRGYLDVRKQIVMETIGKTDSGDNIIDIDRESDA